MNKVPGSSQSMLHQRIAALRWALPLMMVALVMLYQLVIMRWVHDTMSDPLHFTVEVIFYATTGPILAYWVLNRIRSWLVEKEDAERRARTHEQRLASITAASADAILSLDPQGMILSWNRGAELLFGYSADRMLKQPLTQLLSGEDAAEIELQWLSETARQQGFVRGHETACRRIDGSEAMVELTATHIQGDQGTSVILRDITLRKQREEEIRRLNTSLNEQVADRTRELAEKVEALARANAELQKLDQMRADFISLVSHQVRAPLTNMRGAVEQMQVSCPVALTLTCAQMFSIVSAQMDRLDRLVSDVLDAARLEVEPILVQAEPLSILPVIRQAVEQMRARRMDHPIRLPTRPGLPLVDADRERLVGVLVNLLDNADKYSPPGGEIGIDVRADETEVTVSVRSSGPGIPEADLERIFDKFYRVESGDSQRAYGYGLGLYICRRFLEAQGGRIWAENRAGGGCVFSFALPVWEGE